MNHATPKARNTEQPRPVSHHHAEPTPLESRRTGESSDQRLAPAATNAPDWRTCGVGASFCLDEVLAALPVDDEMVGLDDSTHPTTTALAEIIRPEQRQRSGLTLLELVVVLMITVALAAVVVPLISEHVSEATETATKATLAEVRNAVTLFWQDDDRSPKQVPKIHDLFVDPSTGTTAFRFDPTYKLGWRGPYLREATGSYEVGVPHASFAAAYGNTGDRALLDAWGHPVVIQTPGAVNGVQDVRVVSAGSNGAIEISPATFSSALNDSNDGDDVYVAFTLR